MWLYRGAQSAVFYYASCTPCANAVDRRKRKKDAARSQREKEKCDTIITDQPRPFAQPTAFSTNEGWKEEIALGPGPPARRHRPNNHQRTESWRTDPILADSSAESNPDSASDSRQKKDKSGTINPLGDRWNWMKYQREDEPLWGQEVKGSSIGLSGRGRADTNMSSKYYIARAPPVNDLHPPIVSGPRSRAETRWMLQPPPSAKVMAGKERSIGDVNLRIKDTDQATHTQPKPTTLSPETNEQRSNGPARKTSSREQKIHRPPPITISSEKSHGADNVHLPKRPPLALTSMPHTYHGRDESRGVTSNSPSTVSSPTDSELRSPSLSWQYPETPVSRPVSKATDDNGKFSRPSISKTLSTVQRDSNNKKIHLVHVEINDGHDDFGYGQLERVRPWRWSMDI